MAMSIPSSPDLRPDLVRIRQDIEAARADIRAMHVRGDGASAVCAALTAMLDRAVRGIFEVARSGLDDRARAVLDRQLAVAAVGGFGRGDLAPHSDVDLLFVTAPDAAPETTAFVSGLIRDLWDAGVAPSQSVRTPADCAAMAREDLSFRTAVLEVRPLLGHRPLLEDMRGRLGRVLRELPLKTFIEEVRAERAREHQDYHARTVCLLEPNVKKSPGGLRDYHMLRWVSALRCGRPDPTALRDCGLLSDEDARTVSDAVGFLLHLRHEMHFSAGGAQDVLTREEQMRLATWLGYRDDERLLGVERFMRDYYRQTARLDEAVARLLDRLRGPGRLRRVLGRLVAERLGEGLVTDRVMIGLEPDAPAETLDDAATAVRLFDLARCRNVRVDHATLERLRAGCDHAEVSPLAKRRFLEALGRPGGLGHMLSGLHRVGMLERLIPAFGHARGLIQFNLLHKYTIDEHSIRAVEAAAARETDRGPVGRAWREIRRKDLLHLAILIHDLGKGLGGDHSEAGRGVAERIAADFGLDGHESRVLVFLVHRHLLMAHTAFRRDVDDPQTILRFARDVGTPELLRMLYVLTAADTEAVSPGNWNTWKESLLTSLYVRAAEALTGEVPGGDEQAGSEALRLALLERLRGAFDEAWIRAQLAAMPASYLSAVPPEEVAGHLRMIRDMPQAPVAVASRFLPEPGFVEYTVVTRDDLTPGIFARIAGVLAAEGIEVEAARIITRQDGVVLDTFLGRDTTFSGEPPPARREEVAGRIVEVLSGRLAVEELMARRRRVFGAGGRPLLRERPQVEIDNDTSDRFTILEVFADDRPGRLYAIARTLLDSGLSVRSARISTRLDQIVDCFYVTDRDGGRLADPDRIAGLRTRLLEVLAGEG